ncbi:MAG TPA: SEC-C metal-binding domain-containing protein [Noviherbaspirillum sp.]|nr:SEC-C metal-binding domain-containing protein [Noviherbaspirillum sp.]
MEAKVRAENEIFAELTALCQEPGYVHAIAYFCYRDNTVGFNDEMQPQDMLRMYSPERLLRTEISTLLGLLVQTDIDYAIPPIATFERYIEQTGVLLEELHQAMSAVMWASMIPAPGGIPNPAALARGAALREPIFYGGESAYPFQYRDFAPLKYAGDNPWLLQHKGFAIESAKAVAQAIVAIQNDKLLQLHHTLREQPPETWTLLPAYLLTAEEVAAASTLPLDVVTHVLQAFLLTDRNRQFQSVGDFNATNAAPLLRTPDGKYLLFQYYSFVEAIYESPFYWMMQDKGYRAQASEHRGQFTESFAAQRLTAVFGSANVHQNVDLVARKGVKLGEIDVLVLFGDRLIVVQAKSKRLTLEARKGNDGHLRSDFKAAIQDSYDQARECAVHLLTGECKLVDAQGIELHLKHKPTEIFPFCVVADHYPALSFQAGQFLKAESTAAIRPPFVMDVFLLDAMTEMLESPLRLLGFIRQRAAYAGRLSTPHELTVLSYHLKRNLWLDDEANFMMLGDDIAVDLDIAMGVRREGIPGARTPEGILTKLSRTLFERLIQQIEQKEEPTTIELGFLLLTMGEDTCRSLDQGLRQITGMTRADGKAHDFTLGIATQGVTVHCNPAPNGVAAGVLGGHCYRRKYMQRAPRWFGLCVDADANLRFGVMLDFEWEYSAELEQQIARTTRQLAVKASSSLVVRGGKIGRNDPCPCGSGSKYKKCCIANEVP